MAGADAGWSGTYSALEDAPRKLLEAAVTPNHISLLFRHGGALMRLEAVSKDGICFHGRFGHPQVSADQTARLILYKAGGARLLYGQWVAPGAEGRWLFELYPPPPVSAETK